MGFILYSPATTEAGTSRSASREAEGTGPVTPRQPAHTRVVPTPAGWMPSDGRKEGRSARHRTSLPGLRDPLPARPDRGLRQAASARSTRSTTGTSSAARVTRESIEAGPARSGATPTCCRSRRPPSSGSRPGARRSCRRRGSRRRSGIGELWLKLDTANPTHSFKDRVVAVACARRSSSARRRSRARRPATSRTPSPRAQPRRGSRRSSSARPTSSRRSSSRRRSTARRIYAVEGSYDDCTRLTVELSFELDWAFVNVQLRSYYAEGSKTLAFEIAEQLGWELPTRRRADRVGRDVHEAAPGLRGAARARARRRASRRGCSARRRRAARPSRPRSPTAAGEAGAAEHDRPLARDR